MTMTTVLVAVLALHAAVAVGAAIPSTTPPLPQGLRGATDEPLQLHLFTATTVASKHTVCLDGSPSGFYFRPASTPASAQKWVFFLQGGGLCVEPVDCLERTKSALGSSSKWPSQAEQAYVAPGLLSSNLTLSPWATYNHVWLRYCTGDCHAGMETKKNLDGVQFSGFFQITETIFALNATYGFLTRAEDVLWAGGSAGGIGVFNTANYVFDMLSSAPSANVRIVPQAGYFFPPETVAYIEWIVGVRVPVEDPATVYLGFEFEEVHIDQRCAAALKALGKNIRLCLSASTVYPFIQPRVFLRNNIFDSVELEFMVWEKGLPRAAEYLTYYGQTMVDGLWNGTQGRPQDAVMLSACLQHTSNLCLASATEVNGYTYRDVLIDWFFGTNKLPHRLLDDCYEASGRVPCNPICSGPCDPQ